MTPISADEVLRGLLLVVYVLFPDLFTGSLSLPLTIGLDLRT